MRRFQSKNASGASTTTSKSAGCGRPTRKMYKGISRTKTHHIASAGRRGTSRQIDRAEGLRPTTLIVAASARMRARFSNASDHEVALRVGHARAARQADALIEQALGDRAADRFAAREHRLQVHRLPHRPRFDVDGFERVEQTIALS